jgi:uncharacterized protein (DUF362 family)
MSRVTRRQFLGYGAKAAVGGGVAGLLAGCPQPAIPPDTPYEGSAQVAAILGDDLGEMARSAMDAFGGAASFVEPGETVFIKPNFGAVGMVKYNAIAAGDCVKPEIVVAVAEECLKAGASRVTIGDAGQAKTWNWEKVLYLDGSTNIAAEVAKLNQRYGDRVRLACLNADSPGWDPLPSPYTKLGEIYVSSLITRADKVISVAVIKSHRWCSITGTMKNFVGSTSTDRYGFGIQWRFMLHDAGIDQCFLDVVKAVKPVFGIVDCSVGVEGNGPHVLPGYWGTSVDMRDRLGQWLLLASDDLAAVDATAGRVISQDIAGVKHLNMAMNQNVGQIQEERIELVGASLDELRVPWKPAQLTEGFNEVIIPGMMLLL